MGVVGGEYFAALEIRLLTTRSRATGSQVAR
jgi:hypothetical protein